MFEENEFWMSHNYFWTLVCAAPFVSYTSNRLNSIKVGHHSVYEYLHFVFQPSSKEY